MILIRFLYGFLLELSSSIVYLIRISLFSQINNNNNISNNNMATPMNSLTIVLVTITTVFLAEMMVSCVPVNMRNSCKAIPFEMPIKEDGCEEISVKNSFCLGFCVSQVFSTGGKCRICIPSERLKKIVFLKCKRTVNGRESMVQVPRQIEIVKSCSCNKCPKVDLRRYFSRSMTD